MAVRLGATWTNLDAAAALAESNRARIAQGAEGIIPADASLVVCGSLARGEATPSSDVDWTLLIDGQAYSSHEDAANAIHALLEDLELKNPGPEGVFGGPSYSHEILHRIGGSEDTNRNTTLRLLLLLESRAIGATEAHSRVVRQVLKRYVAEDFGWIHGRNPRGVPRFLQNDIARYWRTVAVDFAYKRRARQAAGWALRTVKLRLSRKLTYVAGLLACYSCAGVSIDQDSDAETRVLTLVQHLVEYLSKQPLEIVAINLLAYLDEPGFETAARELFGSYDAFTGLLANDSKRLALQDLRPEDVATSPVYEEARALSHSFQNALDVVFLEQNDTPIYELTKIYGVF